MSKTLFIRNGKVVRDGVDGDIVVPYYGDAPSKVICLEISSAKFYFADERDAHALMQTRQVDEVVLLPVEDAAPN